MSGTANNQPSTIKSYVDSGIATAQNLVGSVTGNNVDQKQAEDRKVRAEAENSASHSAAKAGPLNLSSSGATTLDSQDRREGKTDQLIGSGKEFAGNVVGSENLRREGRDQNAQGQGQEAYGKLKDLASGVADRVTGTIGAAASGVAGNKDAKSDYTAQHDRGKTTQRGVEIEAQNK